MSDIHIAILDDHLIFLDAIALLIENIDPSYRVTPYSAPKAILNDIREGVHFDLILCDLIMNSMNGLAFLAVLRGLSKTIPVIILSGINTSAPIKEIHRIGGNGFVHKSASNDVFSEAIADVLAGKLYFDASILEDADSGAFEVDEYQMDQIEDNEKLPELGPRQIEVLNLIADGRGNRDIATQLFISENTVKTHLKTIFRELGVNKRTACIRKAQSLGII